MKLFEGKTVLVTGSTRGIGNAVALAFAREGAKVVLTGTSAVKATEAAQAVSSATGAEVLGIELKVDSATDCSSAVEKTLKKKKVSGEPHFIFSICAIVAFLIVGYIVFALSAQFLSTWEGKQIPVAGFQQILDSEKK